MKPIISMISAMSRQRMIGLNNTMPWYLPEDLKHFKRLTLGKPMIMGRQTWESLPGLLPERQHIVITRNTGYTAEDCDIASNLEKAIKLAGSVDEIMIVGGGQIYQQFLETADNLYITRVDTDLTGDVFFPEWSKEQWQLASQECRDKDERHQYDFCFEHYVRKV